MSSPWNAGGPVGTLTVTLPAAYTAGYYGLRITANASPAATESYTISAIRSGSPVALGTYSQSVGTTLTDNDLLFAGGPVTDATLQIAVNGGPSWAAIYELRLLVLNPGQAPICMPAGTTATATGAFRTETPAMAIDCNQSTDWNAGTPVDVLNISMPAPYIPGYYGVRITATALPATTVIYTVSAIRGGSPVALGTFSGAVATTATDNEFLFPGGPVTDANLQIAVNAGPSWAQINEARLLVNPIATVAGGGSTLGDGGPATSALLNTPIAVVIDSAGNLYISETSGQRIRKVTPAGIITTLAGNGTAGFLGDGGPAASALISSPRAMAVDTLGNLYFSDFGNNRVRKITPAGNISTVAGGGASFADGGPATSTSLLSPTGITVDAAGSIFISDQGNARVRKVAPDGTIRTIAGTGVAGFSGDGGPATSATINQPTGLTVDVSGNLYFLDLSNARIRKVDTSGIITTIAGTGVAGFSGDGGPATSAQINFPIGLLADSQGNLYLGDFNNNALRKITTGGIIGTVAGMGPTGGFSGDGGAATSALLNGPRYMTLFRGKLFFVDQTNNRVRWIRVAAPEYMAGDAAPFTGSSRLGSFGDGTIDNFDLIQALRAVTSVPGSVPPACSDRFDAIDSFPDDTATSWGGDGVLNNFDLILTLRRVTGLVTARPQRPSRELVCAAGLSPKLPDLEVMGRHSNDGASLNVHHEPAELGKGGHPRWPIYLEITRDMTLAGVSYSVGLDGYSGLLGFEPGEIAAPALLDSGTPGILAMAWLEEMQVFAGQRILLGYVIAPDASRSARQQLRVFGFEATEVGQVSNLSNP